MKKSLSLLALPLALASCGLFGLPKGDVTGSIYGSPNQNGNIRLALIGAAGYQNNAVDQVDVGTLNPQKSVYAVTLPSSPKDGYYELLAYVDSKANNKYDADTEKRTQSNGKVMVYSANGLGNKDGSNLLNLKAGWSLIQNGQVVKSGLPFNSYDLNW
ncbi:hypothetical protein [Deinococcus sp. DB0503]|uniref:hypothetical protein n=1 Tax=Deinococcus sp. DB0503 TaxID=2479203 RepID=UPI0018E051F4|nr:hypothetical protein [Deinococcus sp. DB0503]MBI0446121.1 hypothetical protein [Deinococcus sp. DB0503]